MTRLEKLCELHDQSGGTIHEFNNRYGVDFLEMPDYVFDEYVIGIGEALDRILERNGEI